MRESEGSVFEAARSWYGSAAARWTVEALVAMQLLLFGLTDAGAQVRPSIQQNRGPATTDEQVLARLGEVKVILSDRATPGEAHFVVDEESFRSAFGLGGQLTTVDVASVGVVAASALQREAAMNQQRVSALEAQVGSLRFRSNILLLLVAVLLVAVWFQRREKEGATSD